VKFGVVVSRSNCDRDVAYVTRDFQPTRMVWHEETDISDLDVVVIPGGFSYGDYLRCGAIARFSPVMRRVVEHAQQKFVLGICNGFQVLTEAGLLPGIGTESDLHFICDRVPVKVERSDLAGRKLIHLSKLSLWRLPTVKDNIMSILTS